MPSAVLLSFHVRYLPFGYALPGINFIHSDSTAPNGENFFIFRANGRGVLDVCPLRITQKKKELSRYEACKLRVTVDSNNLNALFKRRYFFIRRRNWNNGHFSMLFFSECAACVLQAV